MSVYPLLLGHVNQIWWGEEGIEPLAFAGGLQPPDSSHLSLHSPEMDASVGNAPT